MLEQLDFWKLIAGLGAFLFGMLQLEEGLKKLAGKTFRRFLRQSTSKPAGSVLGGMVATAIVQSSSLVGLIVLAFVGAGIIPLVNAIGIVIGANLGTTFTGWIVATVGFKFDLQAVALPLFGIGGLGYTLLKDRWQSLAQFLLGFGLLLLGLDLMKTSVGVLATQFDFQSIADFPIIVFLLLGVVLTAIIQSSSATMMITLSALYAGIIPLPAAAAIVIGGDLGTTSTVLLGSLQGAVSKRRVAMAHVLFNLTVDVIAFSLIIPLLKFITDVVGLSDPLYTLVLFHSLFNFIGIILFFPFLKPFSHFLEKRIREDVTEVRQYISEVPPNVTDAALEALKQESRRLVKMAAHINLRILKISHKNLQIKQNTENTFFISTTMLPVEKQYETIKRLEGEIVRYAMEVQSSPIEPAEAQQIERLLDAVRHAVYSAKSLKDIRADLSQFHEMDKPDLVRLFDSLSQQVTELYSVAIGLIDKHHEHEYFSEELENLQSKLKLFHHEFMHNLYQARLKDITGLELSTLMNVNREVRASCDAFLKSIARAWYTGADEYSEPVAA